MRRIRHYCGWAGLASGACVLGMASLSIAARPSSQPAARSGMAAAPVRTVSQMPQPPAAAPEPSLSGQGASSLNQSTTIDLASALQLAGVQNPEILLARERITEMAAIRQFAAAQILPNINGGMNFDSHSGALQQSNGHILNVARSALFVGAGANAIAAGSVSIPGVMWNQNLSQGMFTYLVARQSVRRAQFQSQAVRNETLKKVALAYVELLRNAGRRAIAIKIRDDASEIARLTAAFARTGEGRQADADRAATELAKREMDVTVADGELALASAQLARLLNLDPSLRLQPAETWVVPNPIVPEPITLQELIGIAALRRPELAAQRQAIAIAMLNLQGARILPFSPTTLVGYSAGLLGGGSNLQAVRFGNFAGRNDFDVVAYWTLQNLGVGNRSQVNAARSRLRQSDLERLEMLNAVRTEVATSYARAKVRFAQIATAERAVQTGIDSFSEDMVRTQNNEGRPIEVLDSLRLLGRARFEYLDAIAEYNAAQFELYVALGQPPADALARPAEGDQNEPAVPSAARPGGSDHASVSPASIEKR